MVPLLRLALSQHSQGLFLSSVFCLILFFLSSPLFFFFTGESREMLPKHCKLIMVLNIYYMMAGGLHGHDANARERAGERNVCSSSGSSLRSHALSVSQGTTAAHVPQRNCWKTRTNYKDTWLLSYLANRFAFIALERKLPVLVVFFPPLTSPGGQQSTLIAYTVQYNTGPNIKLLGWSIHATWSQYWLLF